MYWWIVLAEASKGLPRWMLVGAGVFFLICSLLMMSRTRRRIAQNKKNEQMAKTQRFAQQASPRGRDFHDNINELMAELADLARQVNGQLDTRMAKLEILLRQADETIQRLAQAQNYILPSGNGDRSDSSRVTSPKEEWKPPRNPLLDNPIHKQALELFANKLTPLQIAQKMGRPVGEIELILSLHGKNNDH